MKLLKILRFPLHDDKTIIKPFSYLTQSFIYINHLISFYSQQHSQLLFNIQSNTKEEGVRNKKLLQTNKPKKPNITLKFNMLQGQVFLQG